VVVIIDGDSADVVRCREVDGPPRVLVDGGRARLGIIVSVNGQTSQRVHVRSRLNGTLVQRQIFVDVTQ